MIGTTSSGISLTERYILHINLIKLFFHTFKININLKYDSDYGLYLSSGASMDYDTQNAYVLTLSCTDSHGAKTTGTYTVNLIRNEVSFKSCISYV